MQLNLESDLLTSDLTQSAYRRRSLPEAPDKKPGDCIDKVYTSGYTNIVNVKYTIHSITFEWDSQKAANNLRKHKVTFELACEAFFDPFVRYLTEELVNGEHRETIIGLTTKWQLLYVVYVMHNDIIRIVSARLVTNAERGNYENQ